MSNITCKLYTMSDNEQEHIFELTVLMAGGTSYAHLILNIK